MTMVGGRVDMNKLAPWASAVLTALVAGATVLGASNYRAGADQFRLDEQAQKIAKLENDSRNDHDAETKIAAAVEAAALQAKDAKDAANQASVSAQQTGLKVVSLEATIENLKDAVARLAVRSDGESTAKHFPSP